MTVEKHGRTIIKNYEKTCLRPSLQGTHSTPLIILDIGSLDQIKGLAFVKSLEMFFNCLVSSMLIFSLDFISIKKREF